jgi:2-amino-4-hydroxy-6-hydroxymethyldihydropteridine diphosphokinase
MPQLAVISLGSNLGNKNDYLHQGLNFLKSILAEFQTSSIYETEPWGVSGIQPSYYNMVACGYTNLAPEALLKLLAETEGQAGRKNKNTGEARTLDLDIIFMGNLIYQSPTLSIPHPLFSKRNFVLMPLSELLPEFKDPATGIKISDLLEKSTDSSKVKKIN